MVVSRFFVEVVFGVVVAMFYGVKKVVGLVGYWLKFVC